MRPGAIIITINSMIIIFIEVYLRAGSTARGPVTETEQIYVKGGESDTYNTHQHDLKERTIRT
jgi:hypothetical protein